LTNIKTLTKICIKGDEFMIKIEERKKWLQWIIDLIEMDLQSVPKWQKEKLLFEASYFCGKHFYSFDDSIDFERYEEFASPEEKSPKFDLDKLQAVLMEWLKKIEIVAAKGDSPELPSRSFLTFLEYPHPLPGPRKRKRRNADFDNISGPIDPGDYKDTWKRDFEIINEPIDPEDYTNWAIINFMRLIDGIGTDSVKKCKGCGRYFVNVTQMEKIYCTPSCASRSIVKANRDELLKDPEKSEVYHHKQRKYSRDYYRRKQIKLHGPNVRIGKKRTKVKNESL
jgi:hypothetical protein